MLIICGGIAIVIKTKTKSILQPLNLNLANPYPVNDVTNNCAMPQKNVTINVLRSGFHNSASKMIFLKLSNVKCLGIQTTVASKKSIGERTAILIIYINGYIIIKAILIRKNQRTTAQTKFEIRVCLILILFFFILSSSLKLFFNKTCSLT